MRKLYLLVIFIFAFISNLLSSEFDFSNKSKWENHQMKAYFYSVKSHNNIVWGAVYAGLSKFDCDTKEFTVFEKANSDIYSNGKDMKNFAIDSSGNVWMYFDDGIVQKFDGTQFYNYNLKSLCPGYSFYNLGAQMECDKSNTVYIHLRSIGLFIIQDNEVSLDDSSLYLKYAYDISIGEDDYLYLINSKGMYQYKDQKYIKKEIPGHNSEIGYSHAFEAFSDTSIFLLHEKGFFLEYNFQTNEIKDTILIMHDDTFYNGFDFIRRNKDNLYFTTEMDQLLKYSGDEIFVKYDWFDFILIEDLHPYDLTFDKDGNLIILTTDGLYYDDEFYYNEIEFPKSSIKGICGRNHDIFISMYSQIFKVESGMWIDETNNIPFEDDEKRFSNIVYYNGRVYFASDKALYELDNDNTWKRIQIPYPDDTNKNFVIMADNYGVYIVRYGEVFVYSFNSNSFKRMKFDEPDYWTFSNYQWPNINKYFGKIWLITPYKAYMIDPVGIETYSSYFGGSKSFSSTFEYKNKFYFIISGKFYTLQNEEFVLSDDFNVGYARNAENTEDGNLWIFTGEKAYIYQDYDIVDSLDYENSGIHSSVIHGVFRDKGNHLWFYNYGGLSIYRNEGVDLRVEEKESNDLIQVYPNPSSDILHLKSENGLLIKSIQIIDLNGRVVTEYQKFDSNIIDIKNLNSGSYIIRIHGEKDIFYKTFVKL